MKLDELDPPAEKPAVARELETAIEPPPEDVPPEGGYGWVVVGALFFLNSSTWGISSSYGVFLAHYLEEDVFPDATALMYAFVGGISIATCLLVAPLVTTVLRATGSTRMTMSIGLVLEFTALVCASFATRIWQLFLTQGALFGIGMGFLFTASVGTTSQWFSKKRSVANGLNAAGSGIGGLMYSLATRSIITNLGLAWAFRIMAVCALVINGICTFLIKDRNRHITPNQRSFDMNLLRRYEFMLVLAWGFFSMLGYITILFSLPDFAASIGLSKSQGAILNATLNLGMAFGRPLVGLASDQYGRINVGGALTLATGLSCFAIWIPSRTFPVVVFFSLANGAICGTFWTTIAPVAAEVVGIKELPSALSLVWLALVAPTMCAEPIALYLRRPGETDAYLFPQVFAGLMFVVAAGMMLMLRAWKIGEDEKGLAKNGREGKQMMDRWRNTSKWGRYAFV